MLQLKDFYDLLIEKTLEFMNVNTFALFFNSLPMDFREDLNSTIQREFGGASFTDLINMKTQDPGSLQDICSFSAPNRIMKIFERYDHPLKDDNISQEDKEFVKNNLGEGEFYNSVRDFYTNHYDRDVSMEYHVYSTVAGNPFERDEDGKVLAPPPFLGFSQYSIDIPDEMDPSEAVEMMDMKKIF